MCLVKSNGINKWKNTCDKEEKNKKDKNKKDKNKKNRELE
jgi:hypothetical protein